MITFRLRRGTLVSRPNAPRRVEVEPMILLLIPLVGLAIVVGLNFGWQWILAPLLGLFLLRWLLGSLRALVTDAKHAEVQESSPEVVNSDERTLFWCEECGTEVLLLVRGTSRAPSHCGQRMHERTEILS